MLGQLGPLLLNPRLHHVGIISPSEKQALAQMALLGLEEDYRGYVERWDVLCIFTRADGGTPLEFVVPHSAGPLKAFHGGLGGLHHIALTVSDLEATAARLVERKLRMLEDEPVKGAGPFLCNFLSPLITKAFAVELVQLL